MSCRVHYREQVEKKVKEAFGVGRTSAKEVPGNKILLTVSPDNSQLKDKVNVVKWAERVVESLNKRFRTDIMGNLVELDTTSYPKAVMVKYNVPSKLIEYYINKYATPVRKSQLKKIVKTTSNPETIEKINIVFELPASFREDHWADIKMAIDDDFFSTDNFRDFIEHLKNCK